MSRYFKQSIVAAFVLSLVSGHAFTQDVRDPVKNMEISINPLQLFLGTIPLTFRVAVTNRLAIGINVQGQFFGFGKDTKVWSVGGGLSTKFFLSGTAISDSWYVEPQFGASYTDLDSKDLKGKFWTLTPAVIAGYTWVWNSGFVINLGLGAQYKIALIDKGKETPFGISGILPTGEFSLGWAW